MKIFAKLRRERYQSNPDYRKKVKIYYKQNYEKYQLSLRMKSRARMRKLRAKRKANK